MILSKHHWWWLLLQVITLTYYVCLKLFLDSTTPNDDVNIQINGYSLLRADHPNDIKQGSVCIHSKELLPLIRRNDLTNIKDCLITETNVNNEKCCFRCLYRSES